MSHFSVLVIGDNVEEQLAPYHEFECTGLDDQYVKDIEIDLEELRSAYLKKKEYKEQTETFAEYVSGYCGYEVVPFGKQPNLKMAHKYGYSLIDAGGNVVKIIYRTNPNAKWDWWVIGGRWSGMLKLKPKVKPDKMSYGEQAWLSNESRKIGYVDSARICDIDFDGMKSDFKTYATVMNGKWLARGDMGWFGLSDEKLSEDEWAKKFRELLSSLDPNTRITVVDCHI